MRKSFGVELVSNFRACINCTGLIGETCYGYVIEGVAFKRFWGLTCDFWAVFEKNNATDRSLRPSGYARAFGRAVTPMAWLFMARVNACPSSLDSMFDGCVRALPVWLSTAYVRALPVWVLMVCRDTGKSRSLRDDNKRQRRKKRTTGKATAQIGRLRFKITATLITGTFGS
jgi:hypothetical protein